MDKSIPWKRLEERIAPHYPKVGNGRQPYPLSSLLRIHCLQHWYELNDPAMEDALYEITSASVCRVIAIQGAYPR